jgi:hypothetical protein
LKVQRAAFTEHSALKVNDVVTSYQLELVRAKESEKKSPNRLTAEGLCRAMDNCESGVGKRSRSTDERAL